MKTSANQKRTQMLYLFFFFINICFCLAQDRLIFANGEEIKVKILEKSFTEIRYKSSDNPEGPIRVALRSSVFAIKYADGSTDLISVPEGFSNLDAFGIPNKVVTDTNEFILSRNKKFNGPRLGFTYITNGTTAAHLSDRGKNPFVTQIGWQFEERIFSIEGGPCGLVEFVPLIGGMEQGIFLPSANLLIGLRSGSKNSIEFAMGPNISVTGLGMVFAGGANFRSGKVNFPVSLAVVPSVGSKKVSYDSTGEQTAKYFQTGWRISLTIGFNSRKQ